jgi:hypothetical protein
MRFLELRYKIIKWLAGNEMSVILNSKVYDVELIANYENSKHCLFNNNKTIRFDEVVNREVDTALELARHGVRRSGRGFALDPKLMN